MKWYDKSRHKKVVCIFYYNKIRPIPRIVTPTDNPITETKNIWIKKEMYIDFN